MYFTCLTSVRDLCSHLSLPVANKISQAACFTAVDAHW